MKETYSIKNNHGRLLAFNWQSHSRDFDGHIQQERHYRRVLVAIQDEALLMQTFAKITGVPLQLFDALPACKQHVTCIDKRETTDAD